MPELKPLGVGINLLPHSVRVLYDLDLGPQLDQIANRTSALHYYYNEFGQQIWVEPRGLDAGYSFPQYSIHRGELQLLLLKQVLTQLGISAVHTGTRLESLQDNAQGVSVHFVNNERKEMVIEGECLIAADGINSTARRRLYPGDGRSIYGGRILWRGTTEADPFLNGRTMFMAGYQDCKFVAYAIASLDGGRALINWIAELSVPDLSTYRRSRHRKSSYSKEQEQQDWHREVSTEVFKGPFQSWKFPWLDIPTLIENCDHIYEFPLADRDPLPRWSHGMMTLVGDSAHPMYPIGSNGASQGILDVEKLAAELNKEQNIQQAFSAYEAERRPATVKIVLLNRQTDRNK